MKVKLSKKSPQFVWNPVEQWGYKITWVNKVMDLVLNRWDYLDLVLQIGSYGHKGH